LLAEATFEQVRHAARELEVLQPTGNLAEGIGRDLAVLCGRECREVTGMSFDEVADPEEDLGALRQRHRAPGRKGGRGSSDCAVDVGGGGEIDLPGDLARGRIPDRPRATGGAQTADPVDPVANLLRRGRDSGLAWLGDLGHGASSRGAVELGAPVGTVGDVLLEAISAMVAGRRTITTRKSATMS